MPPIEGPIPFHQEDTMSDDKLQRLYDVATNTEAVVLDELQHRAGLVWTCRRETLHANGGAWTNPKGKPCERCGYPEEEK
jgi:hypothetical protein